MNDRHMSETLLPNSNISHYRIVSKIGAGGMGEVYLAQDTKLDRRVALKILPADVASNRDRMERFVREAKSAAALNHPHIAQIHEIGEHDGIHYIVMEFIDGVTLREKIHQERTELRKLLKYLQQVAEGLSKAHAVGIVHRDLKPDNIMITRDGFAKVLDFGLAKLIEGLEDKETGRRGDEDPTIAMSPPRRLSPSMSTPGVVMGTVGYMSPEQAQGKTNEIDQRSDVFSFGCILFEGATGKKPFEGESVIKSLHSLIYEPTPQIKDLNPSAPAELQRIVRRCLEKDADDRYQTIKEVAIELKHLRRETTNAIETRAETSLSTDAQTRALVDSDSHSASHFSLPTEPVVPHPTRESSVEYVVTGMKRHKLAALLSIVILAFALGAFALYRYGMHTDAAITSIAVMPFVNESGNADVEYLSDGMTETLITSLSQVPNLNVKARSSVFRYKGKETDPKTAGKELNVQAILNGRVAQRGDQLTLNLELVDVQTENVIWSEQYNRKQTDLVSLQSDIARDVSSKLKIKLSGADEQKLTKNYTQNADAYKLYLQGRFYANKRTPKDSRKAIDCFQQAVSIDPNYAVAYAGLAISYAYLTIYGDEPAGETFPKARESALKASELDSTLAEPHILLGLLKFLQDHDFAGWERESQLALAVNPNSTDAHRLNGFRFLFLGRFGEALAEVQRALEIEPLSTAGNINYSYALFYSGRIDESEAQTKKAIELAPDFWLSHYYLYNVYRFKGNYALAIEELAKSKDLRDETEAAKLIRESFAKGGWQGFLHAVTAQPASMKMTAYNMAGFYAEAGDKDQAFASLNDAVDKADQFIGFVKIDPFMKPLHGDPRFQELLKRVGFPQ
jgi:eukaryotic-like serine/threonine-protein kinase